MFLAFQGLKRVGAPRSALKGIFLVKGPVRFALRDLRSRAFFASLEKLLAFESIGSEKWLFLLNKPSGAMERGRELRCSKIQNQDYKQLRHLDE